MTEKPKTSANLFDQAKHTIPGGVNSPVRAFKAVGGSPVFIQSAKGAYITDVEGKRYLDYVGSWGPMLLGHAHEAVIATVQNACQNGLSFGAPCELETQLAEKICTLIPSIELIRMVNSGTEATMSAIRLARAYTQRNTIIKFEGCYHGHVDSLLVKAGSGALTLGTPTSPGIPNSTTEQTLVLEYNNCEQVTTAFKEHGEHIAAIIVEPVAGNMNCIPPSAEFLQHLRKQCDQFQSLLIFDEVMTGFRVALGGAQSYYNIQPDLTTLGKVIGGGLPVGAFGGKRMIMEQLAPLGPVYQAGTLSGNPIAMSAGLKTLELISEPNFYDPIIKLTSTLCEGLETAGKDTGITITTHQAGTLFGFFFSDQAHITNLTEVSACNGEYFKQFFQAMLTKGIYWAPSAFEASFMSSAHTAEDINYTIEQARAVLKTLS